MGARAPAPFSPMASSAAPPPLTPDAVPARDGAALLHLARTLRAMKRSGTVPPLLDRRYLGLLSPEHRSPWQGAVAEAARGLGARVTWVPPMALLAADSLQARDTARLLGRLYDLLDCEGLPPALVQCLRRDSGVPVYEGMGRPDHPLARLLPSLERETVQADGAPAGDADGHLLLLQALLLHTLL